ncbi:phosphotransferase system sugar-specific EII component [Streptococcus pneumoniae]|nr:phosphotransferase system sugar-specific EII component [Streptococcus pneumoniae]
MNLKQALIDNDSIRLGLEANNWKEAVKVAVDPLIPKSFIPLSTRCNLQTP